MKIGFNCFTRDPNSSLKTTKMPSLIFDKCCLCIDLKTGCFILGYINLVGSIIMTIMTIMAIAGGAVMMHQEDEKVHDAGILVLAVSCILLLFILLALVFSIVLLVGLHKNKPGHLKAYLVYSVIFLVVSIIQFIINCSSGAVTAGSVIQSILTILLGFYFLLVIRSQYYQMKDPSRGPAIYSAA